VPKDVEQINDHLEHVTMIGKQIIDALIVIPGYIYPISNTQMESEWEE